MGFARLDQTVSPAGDPDLPLQVAPHGAASRAVRPPRRWMGWGIGLLLLATLAALGFHLAQPALKLDAPRLPAGNVVAPPAPGVVVGLGKLLPGSRILTIATPYGAGDARILELRVREGQRVEAGAILAVLDSAPVLQAALNTAEATIAARQAALAQARLMVTAGRDEAQAQLASAEAAVVNTRRELERSTALNARGVSADQALEQKRLASQQAVQDAARARAALARYATPASGEQADIALARGNLLAAEAQAAQARADQEKSIIRAPVAGTVLTLQARPGERPGNAGLMSFGDLDTMMAEIEVYESEAGVLRPGTPATLVAATLPRPLTGRITRVGQEVLRQTLTDASPAANTDTRVIRVQVELDAPSRAIAAQFANLQVTTRFTATVP